MPTDLPERQDEHDAQEYVFEVKIGRVRRAQRALCPPALPWWRRWCPFQAAGRVLWMFGEALLQRWAGKG